MKYNDIIFAMTKLRDEPIEEKIKALNSFDYELLYCILNQHKIQNIVYVNTKDKFNWHEYDDVFASNLSNFYYLNKNKNKIILNEILPELVNILNSNNIAFAILKGAISAYMIYEDYGMRSFSDIDILIKKQDLGKLSKLLIGAGFLQGRIKQGIFQEASIQKIKYYEMVTHQTQPFCIKNEKLAQSYISLDVNFALGSDRRLKNNCLIDLLLERKKEFELENGMLAPILSQEDMFINLCIHIWRDATYIHAIKNNKDIQLYQYVELMFILEKWIIDFDWDYIVKTIREYKITEIIYYSLYFASKISSKIERMVCVFLAEIEPEDKSYLEIFGIENKTTGVWPINFEERIFNLNRFEVIKNNYNIELFEDYQKRNMFFD